MRDELFTQIDSIVADELKAANKCFRANASRHESYAVLLEEYEELKDEIAKLDDHMAILWDFTKSNTDTEKMLVTLFKARGVARILLAEGVQVSAMIDKWIAYMSTEKPKSKEPEVAPVQPRREKITAKTVNLPWKDERGKAIQALKDAHSKVRAEKKSFKKTDRNRIDDSLIVYMRDEQGKRMEDIAKEIGCSLATAYNRYNRGLRNKGKGEES